MRFQCWKSLQWGLRQGQDKRVVEVAALFLRCLQLRGTAEALSSLPVQVGLSSKDQAFLSCLQWRTWPVPFTSSLLSSLKDDLAVMCPLKAAFDQGCVH